MDTIALTDLDRIPDRWLQPLIDLLDLYIEGLEGARRPAPAAIYATLKDALAQELLRRGDKARGTVYASINVRALSRGELTALEEDARKQRDSFAEMMIPGVANLFAVVYESLAYHQRRRQGRVA